MPSSPQSADGLRVAVRTDDPLSMTALLTCLDRARGISAVSPGERADVDVLVLASAELAVRDEARRAAVPAVLVVGEFDRREALRLAAAGVVQVLPRATTTGDRLVRGIRHAATGPVVTGGALLDAFAEEESRSAAPRSPAAEGLLPREVDVLRLLAEGRHTAEIAHELGCATRTVMNVVHNLITRKKLRNRPHAVAYAIRAGVI
ncbi:helix-turn-helix transcriptional regulator [Umezawaea beigongshangensis]|uniref:helix-turn-helix transcriptional regulator n=1 Tax=Umezawaea beigongshangensis TaxID=2780383 RepID=UPI0018F1F8D8|nr:LuxR C-terminal-related transcriptional regulator [Umezawaea beigongshangensis]